MSQNTSPDTASLQWDPTQAPKIPARCSASAVAEGFATLFGSAKLADKIKDVFIAQGALFAEDMYDKEYNSVAESCKESNLAATWADTLARYLLPQDTTFVIAGLQPTASGAKDEEDEAGGWKGLKFKQDVPSITRQLGGAANVAKFKLPGPTYALLYHALKGAKPDFTEAFNILFMMWIVVFKTPYICGPGKTRAGHLLHLIQPDIAIAAFVASLGDAFSNRRQSRKKEPFTFNTHDVKDMSETMNALSNETHLKFKV